MTQNPIFCALFLEPVSSLKSISFACAIYAFNSMVHGGEKKVRKAEFRHENFPEGIYLQKNVWLFRQTGQWVKMFRETDTGEYTYTEYNIPCRHIPRIIKCKSSQCGIKFIRWINWQVKYQQWQRCMALPAGRSIVHQMPNNCVHTRIHTQSHKHTHSHTHTLTHSHTSHTHTHIPQSHTHAHTHHKITHQTHMHTNVHPITHTHTCNHTHTPIHRGNALLNT